MKGEDLAPFVSAAEGSFGSGKKCVVLEKQFSTVRITVCLLDGGRPMMKSTVMWDLGRCGVVVGAVDGGRDGKTSPAHTADRR